MTVPNLLTLSRIPLAGLVWLWPGDLFFVLGLMALAALTDILDGWLERRLHPDHAAGPTVGVWLDPLCDKIFVVSLLTAVTVTMSSPLYLLPLIATREILQTLAALASRLIPSLRTRLRFQFKAALLGKLTTIAQFLAIGALLLDHPWKSEIALLTALLGLSAGGLYILRALRAPPLPVEFPQRYLEQIQERTVSTHVRKT